MKNRIYHILYSIMVVLFVGILIWLTCHYEGKSIIDESFVEAVDFSTGWMLEDGAVVDTSDLRSLEGIQVYKAFSVFNTVPENLEEGQHLCFRSKNIYYKVYLDGELVYDPYVPQSELYPKSFGTRWNYVPISMEDVGKQIEIEITKVYESERACVDNICIGQPAKVIMDTVKEKLVAFITSILLLFVGVLLIVADIPINMRTEKNHELLYLGAFSVSIATWCLAETHLLQYYVGDSRLMQIVSCYSLMLTGIPLVLYLDAAFGFGRRMIVAGMVGASFLSFVVIMFLHLTKIADIRETLGYTHIIIIMSALALLYTITKNTFGKGKGLSENIYRILRAIGLCGLFFSTLIDLWRFYQGISNDSAMCVRIGLLIFILCFGSSSLEKTINAVKLGVQAEFVSKLAYQDGLTGIGNRTAFEEELVDLEQKKDELSTIGILMFDVNDLKYVNDNMGHGMGDKLLMECARLIQESFLPESGQCYRIGGDEFVVLLSGEHVEKHYEAGIARVNEEMEVYNEQPEKMFRISIAHGFAVYDKEHAGMKLMNIYQQADAQMYENKKMIKETQVKPEEYYREWKKDQ